MSIPPPADRRDSSRVPPGQTLTRKFPVLHFSHVPAFDAATYRFRVWGCVERPLDLGWAELTALPRTEDVSDFHCVTTWSRLDNRWGGIAMRTLLERVGPTPAARHVMVHCLDGYTTNVPLAALDDRDVLVAFEHDGQPLTAEHGGPVRLVVPKLYAWKSGKWLTGLEVMPRDKRGFWEERGYHNRALPWAEERYSWQEDAESTKDL
ncbi:MAG: sulfite oxidase-like oxidoreductase [Deltaproteobacteria bacterium]|nr:sulfite oxidase-like oxidoreductase [Deltaproteobacteria bacterium]